MFMVIKMSLFRLQYATAIKMMLFLLQYVDGDTNSDAFLPQHVDGDKDAAVSTTSCCR